MRDKPALEMKPGRGMFVAVAPAGWPYVETTRYRAREARSAMGKLLVGMRFDGVTIEDEVQGWDMAFKRGYRIHKVDIVPAPQVSP